MNDDNPKIIAILQAILQSINYMIELTETAAATHSQPASLAPAQPAGKPTQAHMMTEIIMTYNETGEAAYKLKGPDFAKFGVRIWPEVLPILGIDTATLKPGTQSLAKPIAVIVEYKKNAETGELHPRKVIGPRS